VTPLLGLIATLATTGSLLSTDTLAEPESVSPEPSVAIAEQVMVSDGNVVALLRVKLELVPRVLGPLVHS
jgi:hypothetical protein